MAGRLTGSKSNKLNIQPKRTNLPSTPFATALKDFNEKHQLPTKEKPLVVNLKNRLKRRKEKENKIQEKKQNQRNSSNSTLLNDLAHTAPTGPPDGRCQVTRKPTTRALGSGLISPNSISRMLHSS